MGTQSLPSPGTEDVAEVTWGQAGDGGTDLEQAWQPHALAAPPHGGTIPGRHRGLRAANHRKEGMWSILGVFPGCSRAQDLLFQGGGTEGEQSLFNASDPS